MHPAIRFQHDYLDGLEELSASSGVRCTADEDRARQEYAKDADINILLKRFGVNLPVRNPEYGEVDFDLDLQGAYRAVADAREGFSKLPAHLREKYGSWEALFSAIGNGEVITLTPSEDSAAVPPNPAAASASDSAPVS